MKNKILLIMVIIIVGLSSCKKDDDNSYVKSGTNINVVQNYDLTIHPYDWSYSSTYSEWHYNFYQPINSQSLVMGYIISGNGEQVLPFVSTLYNCRYTMATNLFMSPAYIQFQFTNFNSYTTAPTYDEYLYIVVVPPSQRVTHPNVNYNNYDDVKKAFNLGEPKRIYSNKNLN